MRWQPNKTDNAEFDAYPVWLCAARAQTTVWQATWHGKGMQREQSQDRPMREPFNTTWPTKPAVILKRHDIVGEKKSKDKGGKDWSAKRVGKQQQVTALNLTHSQKRFKHAQRKPKQKYEGQHGTEKDPKTNQSENH